MACEKNPEADIIARVAKYSGKFIHWSFSDFFETCHDPALVRFPSDAVDGGEQGDKRRQQGVKLYYKVLETMLVAEKERLLRVCTLHYLCLYPCKYLTALSIPR